MVRQHAWFCEALVKRAGAAGRLSDDVKIGAIQDAYMAYSDPRKALKKAERLLRKPNVRNNVQSTIRELYVIEDPFTVLDAIRLHKQHMRGEAPSDASYQALKDFQKMILPQAPAKIDQRVLVAHAEPVKESRESLPAMEARVLSASVSE